LKRIVSKRLSFRITKAGANPTTSIYNASVVNVYNDSVVIFYNATGSLARFESKKYGAEKNSRPPA
jgi:hypothetical protein